MLASRKWRDDQRGHSESQSPITTQRLISRRKRLCRRRHMIKKSPPFVKVDDHHCLRPRRTLRHRVINIVQKSLTITYVRTRMIVVRRSARLIYKARIDKRYLRQQTRLARSKELRER